MTLLVTGIDLVEVHLGEVAVEICTENFAAWVEAIAAETMLKLVFRDRAVVEVQPAAGLFFALIAVDVDEFATQFGCASSTSTACLLYTSPSPRD